MSGEFSCKCQEQELVKYENKNSINTSIKNANVVIHSVDIQFIENMIMRTKWIDTKTLENDELVHSSRHELLHTNKTKMKNIS
jgi:hypothetical protein